MPDVKIADLEAEVERLRRCIAEQSHEIEQTIAAVFPAEFPTYPDDWPGGGPDGSRCVGDHIPESMVDVLVGRYKDLQAELDCLGYVRGELAEANEYIAQLEAERSDWESKCSELEAEIKDLLEERGEAIARRKPRLW